MGLSNTTSASRTYVRISNGKVVMTVKSPNEHTTTRVNKAGKTVYEMSFDMLSGVLTGIEFHNEERNGIKSKEYRLTIADKGEAYCLSVNWDSRNAQNIINALAALESYADPISIRPYLLTSEKTGKPVAGCTVYRGLVADKAKKVEGKYSREDLPQLEQIKFKGETQWDSTKLAEFLLNVVETVIKPRIEDSKSMQILNSLDTPATDEDDDGLPF